MPIQTLSKGYEKPVNPTSGDDHFAAQERNIQRMNDHVHDGTAGAYNTPGTQSIDSGSWVDQGNGTYRQLVALPGSRQFDSTAMEFRLSTGERVHPTIEKVSATSYYIYTNDNTKSYTALYYG